jgi:hypothetical protein
MNEETLPGFVLELPRLQEYGDYCTNIAFKLAEGNNENPADIAASLSRILTGTGKILRAVPHENGFINFYMSPSYFAEGLREILCRNDAIPVHYKLTRKLKPLAEALQEYRMILHEADQRHIEFRKCTVENLLALNDPEEMFLILLLLEETGPTRELTRTTVAGKVKYLRNIQHALEKIISDDRHSADAHIFYLVDKSKVIPRLALVCAVEEMFAKALKQITNFEFHTISENTRSQPDNA